MILVLFLTSIFFIPLCLTGCPNTNTYGLNCQYNCANCSLGCDVSGACVNGSCLVGSYGNGCQENNIGISQAPVLSARNCLVQIIIPTYSSQTSINPIAYFVVYGPSMLTSSNDPLKWPSNKTMTCNATTCVTDVSIVAGSYTFAVYFDFINIKYSEPIQSLLSEKSITTCNGVISPTSTQLTSTLSSTTRSSTIGTTPTTTTASTITTASSLPRTIISTAPTLTTSSNSMLSITHTISTAFTTMPVIVIGDKIQRLVWSSKSQHHIYVTWLPPQNTTNLINYKIVVKQSDAVIKTMFTITPYQNVTGLLPGIRYTTTVTANYSNQQSADSTIIVCTGPTNDITIDSVQIMEVSRKSIAIEFPGDHTNYTCSKNVYVLAYMNVMVSSRSRREASFNSVIPAGATIIWNSTKLPTTMSLGNLRSGTNYKIYAEIYTNVNGTEVYYHSVTYQQTNGPSDGAIIAIVLGSLLFMLLVMILIVLLILYRKRKQRSQNCPYYDDISNKPKQSGDENKPRSFAYWSSITDKMEPRFLILNPNEWTDNVSQKETMAFSNQNYSQDGLKFTEEYSSLPNESPYSHIDAETNHTKNKIQDVFPYDHNRVKLRRTSVNSQSDYVNASFIDGYLRKKAYIASQSPFDDDTINDFWKMVYEQNVGQIVMLTDVEHGNVTNSLQYWPHLHSKYAPKEVMYGTICVKIVDETSFASFDIREFEIKDVCCTVESQLVTQYHFHGWPNNDIPQNCIAFLDFYQTIKLDADISNGPLLVHCGTGISQSAVFIAFDILSQQVIHENCVNVFRTVAQLRRSRSKMIRNSKQYMFLYDVLFESLLCGQFIVNTNVKKVYTLLHKVNPQSKIEYILEQFYLLQTYQNITACQYPNTQDICFVDSIDCARSLSSIASPTINNEKIGIFWNTVFNNKISVIIDLRTTDDKPYYIRDNLGGFDILVNEISMIGECFRKFDISLFDLRREMRVNVIIYQFGTSWVDEVDVKSEPNPNQCGVMVEIIYHLLRNHSHDLILSHCTNGWSKSGLFLTCFNIALKMYRSKYVMVYNVVKSMKFYRSEFVTSFAQYRFIYNFLKKWVDMKMTIDSNDDDYLPGLLPSGDKLKESLFTHEQTPVMSPEQKQRFAPSLQSLGSREYSYTEMEGNDNLVIVHYNVGTFPDFAV